MNKSWRDTAACLDEDPELFFPAGAEGLGLLQTEQAKAICRGCPVLDACLNYALDAQPSDGIFGGLTEPERASLKRSARRHGLTADHVVKKAEQARQPNRERTLHTLFEDNTVRLFGGHLAWTGPTNAWFQGRPYSPKKLAFIVGRGREPEGRVLNDCGNSECLLPAHIADDSERMRCGTRPGYQRHQRNGETPCDACREAAAGYQRQIGCSPAA